MEDYLQETKYSGKEHDMIFKTSQELSEGIVNRSPWIVSLTKRISDFLINKNYGASIQELTVSLVCCAPEFDFFFKHKQKYTKSKKKLQYDLKLDFNVVKNKISENDFVQYTISEIVSSFDKINEMGIENFDVDAMKKELSEYFL
jgi:hypothetical protein